jgi:predicted nucleotidyltransferase
MLNFTLRTKPYLFDRRSCFIMTTLQEIQDYANKIAERFQPEKIILFGSYAYGQPTEDSDVDLLVIMEHDRRNWEKASEIRIALDDPTFALDLLVRPRAHVALRLKERDPFFVEIIEQGKLLRERSDITVA